MTGGQHLLVAKRPDTAIDTRPDPSYALPAPNSVAYSCTQTARIFQDGTKKAEEIVIQQRGDAVIFEREV